ncbi:MAG: response regulator [Planctomycetota bacterium]
MTDPSLDLALELPEFKRVHPDSSDTAVDVAPTVLIVEDDANIAFSLTLRLASRGMETCVASDAPSALEIARRHEPDVAILDINMPGGDGFEVASRLRADPRTMGLPIVFLTASMRPEFKERAEAMESAAFMTKPYDAKNLMDTIGRLLDGGRFQ